MLRFFFLTATALCAIVIATTDTATANSIENSTENTKASCQDILNVSVDQPIDIFKEQEALEEVKSLLLKHPSVQKQQVNPRSIALDDKNSLGAVEKKFHEAFPHYSRIRQRLSDLKNNYENILIKDYIGYRQVVMQKILEKPLLSIKDPIFLFALVDSIEILQTLHSYIDFNEMNEYQDQSESKDKKDEDGNEDEDNNNEDEAAGIDDERQDQYQAANKDLKSSNKKKKPNFAIGTTAPTDFGLMRLDVFEEFETGIFKKIYSLREKRSIRPLQTTYEHHSFFKPKKGIKKMGVYLPYNFEPVVKSYDDFSVKLLAEGEYEIISHSPNGFQSDISIWLEASRSQGINIEQASFLKKKSAISADQWPEFLQNRLNSILHGGGSIDDKLEKLRQYFVNGPDFKYSTTNEVGEADFNRAKSTVAKGSGSRYYGLSLANAKIFNCDGAAALFSILVRDFFQLPTRVATGRPVSGSKILSDGTAYNVVDLNDPRHAWSEVFIGGQWEPFEVTPIEKKPQKGAKKDPLEPHTGKKQPSSPPSDKSSEDSKKDNKANSKAADHEKEKTPSEGVEKTPAQKTDQETTDENGNDTPQERESKFNPDAHTDFLRTQNLTKNLRGRIVSVLAAKELREFEHTKGWRTTLSDLEKTMPSQKQYAEYVAVALQDIQVFMTRFYREENKSLKQIYEAGRSEILTQPTKAYAKLLHVKEFFTLLVKFADLTEEEKIFLQELEVLLEKMRKSNHPLASHAELVARILEDLPGDISREMLLETYKEARKIGSADQENLVQQIMSGDLSGFLRASLVRKHFDFILQSDKVYAERKITNLMRHHRKEEDNEDYVLANVNDISRFSSWNLDLDVDADPVLALLGKLIKGEQYMRGYRQEMTMLGSQNPIERKLSVVYYDISGSMGGDKALMQAAALLAYVDMAFSEKDPFGQPTHTVILFPFGDTVKDGLFIESVEHAKKIMAQFSISSTPATEGTVIQNTFDSFVALVRQHYDKSKNAKNMIDKLNLNRATMILMTDGEDSSIEYKKIQDDLRTLPKDVQIMINLMSISQHNPQLATIAKSTNTAGVHGMYTHITDENIKKFIAEANAPRLDVSAYVHNDSASKTFSSADLLKIKYPNETNILSEKIFQTLQSTIRVVQNKHIEYDRTGLTLFQIEEITGFDKNSFSLQTRKLIYYEVLKRFRDYMGRPLNQLSEFEYKCLEDLKSWAR